MATVSVLRQVSEETVHEEAQRRSFCAPPNLVWRLAIVLHHNKVSFVATRDTGRACIVVSCSDDSNEAGYPVPYRDFQKRVYDMVSDLPNEYNFFDHLGSFYARQGYLLIEVHFSSPEQMVRCIEGIESTVLTQKLRKSLATYVESLRGVDIKASLAVFSNLDSRLKQVLCENVHFAYRLVYNDNPTVAIFHVTDPTVYSPIKSTYDQLLKSFPDFFGECGPISIYPDVASNGTPDVASNGTPDVTANGTPENGSSDAKMFQPFEAPEVQSETFMNSATADVGNHHSSGTTTKAQKERETYDLETAIPPSEQLPTDFQEELSDNELPIIGEMIPRDRYYTLGLHLNLRMSHLERLEHDSKNSMKFILSILNDAKNNNTTRRALACALVQSNLARVAKVVDPSIDITDVPHTKLPKGFEPCKSTGNYGLYLVDGSLHFYDKELAQQHLKTQQPVSFWAALHQRITAIIQESLKPYNLSILNPLVGSFVAKILLVSIQQACTLANDIASGQYTRQVEKQLRAIGYKNHLAVKFKIGKSEATPHNCYKLYLTALVNDLGRVQTLVLGNQGSEQNLAKQQAKMLKQSTAPTSASLMQHSSESNIPPSKKNPISEQQLSFDAAVHFPQSSENTTKRQVSEDPTLLSSQHVQKGTTLPSKLQRSVSHDPHLLRQMKETSPMPILQLSTWKKTEKKMKAMLPEASEGIQIMYSDANILFYLIRKGDIEKVRQLVENGADLSQTDSGHMPIHVAAHCGRHDIIKLIVEHGCNVDAKTVTKLQITPLHLASYFGHLKVAQTLVELGANVEARNPNGWTPLRMAASEGHAEIVEFLLNSGANCNSQCNEGVSPLHAAVNLGRKAAAKVLLRKGADVTCKEASGRTPIHEALFANNADILRLMLKENREAMASPAMSPKPGDDPPVIIACKLNSPDLLQVLLQHKANPNAVNPKENMTPLIVACAKDNAKLIEILIAHGADPSQEVASAGTPLHAVAETGSMHAALKLLSLGIDPNITTKDGVTPLMRAVECNQIKVAELLIKHGANINVKDPHGGLSLLHKAAKRNSCNMLELLITNGADLEQVSDKGNSALHVAAFHGSAEALDVLCTAKCNLDARNIAGITPLGVALHLRKFECASRLLTYKPDVNAADKQNVTPLYLATDFRAVEIVDKLLAAGAHSDKSGPKGVTPIQIACRRGYHEIVELMLQANPSLLASSTHAKPLIFLACDSGSPTTLRLLLEHGADPNTVDLESGKTPLHDACHMGHETMVEDLVKYGADPSLQSLAGTPLHIAVGIGQIKCAQKLLDLGVNPDLEAGVEKATPLIIAAEVNNIAMARLLIEHGAKVDAALANNGYTALHKAASSNFAAMASLLLDSGANGNRKSSLGYTPLHMAASAGSMEILEILHNHNCDINIQDGAGLSPLMRAIHDKQVRTATQLLNYKADINLCAINGLHSLHFAAQVRAAGIIEKLLSLGASPNVQESDGATPLHIAVSLQDVELSRILLSNKALPNIADHRKTTPLHLAAASNNSELVQLLLKHGANSSLCDIEQKTPADMTKSENIKRMLTANPSSTTTASQLITTEGVGLEEVTPPNMLLSIGDEIAKAGLLPMLVQELKLSKNEWYDIESTHELVNKRVIAALELWKSKQTPRMSEQQMKADLSHILQKLSKAIH